MINPQEIDLTRRIGKNIMTQSTESEIQQLKNLINNRFDRLDKDLTELKVSSAKIEEKVNGIDKRLELLEARVNDQDKRFWAFIASAFLALFAILARLTFFPRA